jgi:hypothetical protein
MGLTWNIICVKSNTLAFWDLFDAKLVVAKDGRLPLRGWRYSGDLIYGRTDIKYYI